MEVLWQESGGKTRVSWVPQGRHSAATWPCHPLTKLTGAGVGPDTPSGRVAPPGVHSTWKLPHVEGGGVGFRKVQASEGQPPHSTPAKAWEGASAWKC